MLKALQCQNTNCTETEINVVDGKCNDVDTGRFESQIIGSDGLPFFTYYENFALKSAHCGDVQCSNSSEIIKHVIVNITSSLDSTGSYTALTLGQDGNPLIAFYDKEYTELNVIK